MGISAFRSAGRGAFRAPLRVVFRSHYFAFAGFVRCTWRFSICQSFLGARTHVYGRRAAIIIEYLQTTAETVARNSVGEDVDLCSHLSSEQCERLAWQRISAVEVDRSDLAQRQRGYGLGKGNAARVDEAAANGDTICYGRVDEVEPRGLTEGQTDRRKANAGKREDVPRHPGLSSSLVARITAHSKLVDGATFRPRRRLGAWRKRKGKRQNRGCEYGLSISHVLYFLSCFGLL